MQLSRFFLIQNRSVAALREGVSVKETCWGHVSSEHEEEKTAQMHCYSEKRRKSIFLTRKY